MRTALGTRRIAEIVDDAFDSRVRIRHPRRSDRVRTSRPDNRERVGKFHGIFADYRANVGMVAYPFAELTSYRILDCCRKIGDGIERQESFKLRNAAEQARIDSAHVRIKREESRHLVLIEPHRLLRVAYGVVQLVLQQLVVLQQRMVRTLREEKRGPVERVDQSETAAS